jgi:hypothetical protein
MYYIYTLRSTSALHATKGRFLVGRASSIFQAFTHHNHPNAPCAFSSKFGPWVVCDLKESFRLSHFELVNHVLYKMKIHGIDNVRGGPWMEEDLCPVERKVLQDILNSEKKTPRELGF